MAKNEKMRHMKRMHNGKRRRKAGDIFQARPYREYVRPCGCTKSMIDEKNKRMMRVITATRPDTVWSENGWVMKINERLQKRFGRCFRHLSEEQKEELRSRGMEV